MSFGSVKLVHNDGKMHHLGIDESVVAKKVILTPNPQQIPFYASLLDHAEKVGEYREYVTYTGTYKGVSMSVMSCGFGCMPMAIAVEELNHLGVEEIIKIAACPALQPEIKAGSLLAGSAAVRSEGATREYIDISYPAVSDMALLSRLLKAGAEDAALFRSHDCLSLDTPWSFGGKERMQYWQGLGVSVVDGETSAMFVIAAILKMRAASLALISENYANGEKADVTDSNLEKLFRTAAEALCG